MCFRCTLFTAFLEFSQGKNTNTTIKNLKSIISYNYIIYRDHEFGYLCLVETSLSLKTHAIWGFNMLVKAPTLWYAISKYKLHAVSCFLDLPCIFFTTLLTSSTKHNGWYFEYNICVISREVKRVEYPCRECVVYKSRHKLEHVPWWPICEGTKGHHLIIAGLEKPLHGLKVSNIVLDFESSELW